MYILHLSRANKFALELFFLIRLVVTFSFLIQLPQA